MVRIILACLGAALIVPLSAAAQCEGISVWQEDEFMVVKHDVDYNCAVFTMHHDVVVEENVLSITEVASLDEWVDCYCPYESKVIVGGMAPGQYTLVFTYGEAIEGEEPAVFTWCELPFTVEGPTAGNDQIMVQTMASGCGMPGTGVPGDPLRVPRTFSDVKALYL